ncbi:cation:proton antiporter [Actinophytocola sp.]|uniref:cation:proton antiporter n=1 Tax=Actinophytocola sp. TaxID=1872138 RepID=UPI002ED1B3EF
MSQLRTGIRKHGWLGVATGATVFAAAVVWWFGMGKGTHEPAEPITHFLLAVAAILLVCHLCGALLRRLGQPAVLGEIIGGLLLGPSVFGLMAPDARAWLFPAHILAALDAAAQLGLIIFLFLLGCELRLGAIRRKRVVTATVLGGTGLPFLAGVGVALLAGSALAGEGPTVTHVLFLGLALSITALPVLARILVDLRMDRRDVGVIALTSAAIGDGVTWLALAVIMAMAGTGDSARLLPRLGLALAFLLVMLLCVRPVLAVLVARARSDQALMAGLVIGAVAVAALSQQIDLHPIIGAFLFGTLIPRTDAMTRVSEQLQGFTITVLLPLFFAGVGLKASFGLVGGDLGSWLLFALVLFAAMASKIVGAGGAARLAGLPPREALQLGTLMNCRGITELVVATVGLQAGLINEYGFTVLVLVAVITSAMTGLVMRRLERTGSQS